jgi:hypothetical protein
MKDLLEVCVPLFDDPLWSIVFNQAVQCRDAAREAEKDFPNSGAHVGD